MDYLKIEFNNNYIDLHHFHPEDINYILDQFIEFAINKNYKYIYIIHGKGKSVMRYNVQKYLEKNENIKSYNTKNDNWGMTIAYLKS